MGCSVYMCRRTVAVGTGKYNNSGREEWINIYLDVIIKCSVQFQVTKYLILVLHS